MEQNCRKNPLFCRKYFLSRRGDRIEMHTGHCSFDNFKHTKLCYWFTLCDSGNRKRIKSHGRSCRYGVHCPGRSENSADAVAEGMGKAVGRGLLPAALCKTIALQFRLNESLP